MCQRTNSAIGDVGATIEWEHLKRFEGLKEAMHCHFKFLKHVNNREKRAMHNLLLKELHEELDDVPVFDSYITTTLLKKNR